MNTTRKRWKLNTKKKIYFRQCQLKFLSSFSLWLLNIIWHLCDTFVSGTDKTLAWYSCFDISEWARNFDFSRKWTMFHIIFLMILFSWEIKNDCISICFALKGHWKAISSVLCVICGSIFQVIRRSTHSFRIEAEIRTFLRVLVCFLTSACIVELIKTQIVLFE